jgi:hypothetical protein
MANGHCRECRFFDGSDCAVRNVRTSAGSSCGNFIDNTEGSNDKHCRACRFYDGQICSARKNVKTSPGSSCGNWAAYRT